MKTVLVIMIALSASGCAIYGIPADPGGPTLSRSEIEATNARAQCRALARNLVQMARCDGR